MYKALKIFAILWAWACWAWVIYSHQWFWAVISFVPYFLFNSFGHHLNKSEEE
jgi:hypothetical protein